ncbi:EAL domain-containing protein [Thiomicrorhabdus indica]|uniref:EAL domain-containing protein n=1 Tax=Thiomicrorhabdus indica TaxID=2267253 RepID=UPI00102D9170|nr:EAL domain-containing protein [Thiomicrorhabdus indica]
MHAFSKLLTIKNKLILSIALIHAILMTVFIIDLTERQKEFLLGESFQSTQALAETLAINATPWVLSNDLAGLEEIIQSQSQQIYLNFAILTNTSGEVLAYYHRNPKKKNKVGHFIEVPQTDPFSPSPEMAVNIDNLDVIDISTPIMLNQNQLGWARVQISRENIYKSIQIITLEGILYASLAIIVGGFFAWLMGHRLTKRIHQLIHITKKIRLGERNLSINLGAQDELQDLANNFEDMLNVLETSETMLFNAKEEAEITLKSIGDAVIVIKPDGKISYMNPVAEVLTGWSRHRAHNMHIDEIMHLFSDIDKTPLQNPVFLALQNGQPINLLSQSTLINRHGDSYSIEDSAAPIIDKNGNIVGAVVVFHDATKQRALQKQLEWQATHDSLTQLHNRQAFETHLDELIAISGKTPQSKNCLVYIDLDQFKVVNDTVGHTAGDQLLRQISQVIKKGLTPDAFLARIGGDEFAILLQNHSMQQAEKIATTLLNNITSQRFFWESKAFDIGASMGIAEIHGSLNKTAVLSRADIACYLAKDKGRNRIQAYIENDDNHESGQQILDRLSELKEALNEQRLVLFGQTLEPLQNQDELSHLEVLVRMLSKHGEIIPPGLFLPAAERFNLMPQVDTYVIKQSLEWLKDNHRKVGLMNINISGQSLADPIFNEQLIQRLELNHAFNHKICFEITETVAITQIADTIDFLNRIKSFGCKLALDDFGSGFSSFSWLKNLPVDYVKIDGSFIRDVIANPIDAAMVRAIKEIGDNMSIQTIAEFVESQEIANWLIETGIDYAQGYHFSKPEALDEIEFDSKQT